MHESETVIVTCEHAVKHIPSDFAHCFEGWKELLADHRGFDLGALSLAREIASRCGAPLFYPTVSRLLVDCNRHENSPTLFSECSAPMEANIKQRIMDSYYRPYREAVEREIGHELERGKSVLHLSIHSFIPILNGVERTADIGLLYDQRRPYEREFCAAWRASLIRRDASFRVRRNYPYQGRSDGFTSFLRRRYSGDRYRGVELEINRRHAGRNSRFSIALRAVLLAALEETLAHS
jgi:predicted N-formylglutamate amidohydrolase